MAPDTGTPPDHSGPRLSIDPAARVVQQGGSGGAATGAVFRDRRSGHLCRLGPEEYFLLREIDAGTPPARIAAAFATRFGKTVRAGAIAAFADQMLIAGVLRDADAPAADRDAAADRDTDAAPKGAPPRPGGGAGAPRFSAPPPGPPPTTSDAPPPAAPDAHSVPDLEPDLSLEDLVFGGDDAEAGAEDPPPEAPGAAAVAGHRRSEGPGAVRHAAAPPAQATAPESGSADPSVPGAQPPSAPARHRPKPGAGPRYGAADRAPMGPGMVRLGDPGGVLRVLDRLLGWSGPLASAMLYPLTLLALLTIFQQLPEVMADLRAGRGALSLFGVLVVSLFTVNLFRVLCVGVTAHRHGATPRSFGLVFLFYIIPRFVIDESAVRRAPRAARLAVPAAAMKSRLWLFGAGILIWAMTRQGGTLLPEIALIVGQIGLVTFLLTALPVLTLDGYRYLSAWFDMPMLRERAFHHVFGRPRTGPGGIPFPPASAAEGWAFRFYVLGAVLFTALIAVTFVAVVSVALRDRFGGAGVLMFVALVALMLVWMTSMKRFKLRSADAAVRGAIAQARTSARAGGGAVQRGAPADAAPQGQGAAAPGLRPARGAPRPGLPGLSGPDPRAARWQRWRGRAILALVLAALAGIAMLPYSYEVGGDFTILPAARVQVAAGVDGTLVEILVDEGDVVREGQLMARLSDHEVRHRLEVRESSLAQALAALDKLHEGAPPEEIAVARAQLASAEALLPYYAAQAERARTLLERSAIPQSEADRQIQRHVEAEQDVTRARTNLARVEAPASAADIAMAEARVAGLRAQVEWEATLLDLTELRAPAAGRVVTDNLSLQLGRPLTRGDHFAEIESHEVARAEVRVPETEIGLVEVGDRVRLRPWALSGREWTGEVRAIAPVAEDERFGRVLRVRTEIDNADGVFRPQMTGQAKIEGAEMRVWQAFSRLFDRFLRIEVWGWIP